MSQSSVLRVGVLICALAVFITFAIAVAPVSAQLLSSEHRAPLTASSGYTLHYTFSADPKDNTFVASFTPDVKTIYGWATVTANNGAPEKQFKVDIKFVAPNGQSVSANWYGSDTGTVTTYPDTASAFGDVNVARRELPIAGTSNAKLTGQWTVNFYADGKPVVSGNFTLAGSNDLAANDSSARARADLTAADYTVTDFGQEKSKDGKTLIAFVNMKMQSTDIYSSETSQQTLDGFLALRRAFPQADQLLDILEYSDRYDIVFFAEGEDVDAYIQSKDYARFSPKVGINVFDKQQGAYLGSDTSDFVNKNFGAGSTQPPTNFLVSKQSGAGSVRVEITPSELPADSKSTADVTVTVYDKRNNPIANAKVDYAICGTARGATINYPLSGTDEKGQTALTLKAGSRRGSVTVTATVSETIGAGTITIGGGSDDPAGDDAEAYLCSRGYKPVAIGFSDKQKTQAEVDIELKSDFKPNQIGGPVLFGLTALRQYYPNATDLYVVIPYQSNYLVFSAAAAEFDAFEAKLKDADATTTVNTIQNYVSEVVNRGQYVDSRGNVINSFGDFMNKKFGGS